MDKEEDSFHGNWGLEWNSVVGVAGIGGGVLLALSANHKGKMGISHCHVSKRSSSPKGPH